MQPGWPPGAPAAYPPGAFAAQQGAPGPQGVQPGQPYGAAPKSANGPPTPRPPGGVAPLAGQMQQMKLGGAPMPAPQPGMPPMGVRPAGLPVAAPGHGMPRPAGPPGTNGFAARPAAPSAFQQQQQRPAGMQQPSMQQPGTQQPLASTASGGFSTPRKSQQQQQQQEPYGTPPPFALQVASPSPTKRAGMATAVGGMQPAGGQLGQQAMQGFRPPMGGMPGMQPPQQQFQQPGMQPPGMQPPGFPGMMPGQPTMPGMQPMPGQPPMSGMPGMQPPMPGMPRPPMPTPPMPTPGAMMAPGVQAAPAASTKIDPSQIPRPLPYAIPTQVFETRRENTHAIPPAADAPIVVRDRGSCGPRFMRSTLNMLPQSNDLLKSSALPLVTIISPLALQDTGDDPVELVEWGPAGPVRCSACKAYVNPYMRFVDGGRSMQCCFCNGTTELPADYVCHTGPDGERRDKYERPELCKGSVEMTVTPAYQVRPPMRPTHFFLVDVSQPAVSTGATAAACSSIARILDDLPGGDRTQICVATFDSTIHFYSMRPGQSQPHMLVVPDVTDVYCPLPGNVVVPLREARPLVEALLDSIPRMFAGSQVAESCGGAALRSAVEALSGGEGGRLHAFLCGLPRRGALHLRLRDVGRPPTDRDTLDSLLPENKEYAALAAAAATAQVSIDLFLLAQGYVDVATLGVLCSATAGSLYHWPAWSPQLDADEFFNDLRWAAMRPQALEAVGRLRCSKGLAVEKYIGSFHRVNDTDLSFPALSSDHAFAAKLMYEEKLSERGEAYLQFALLYSTVDGQRRVRVHTLALPITPSLGTTFRGADLDAYMSYVSRKVASQVPGHALGACKEAITKAAADALLAYRTHCAAASSSGQLILPEALKLLPLYTLALTKAPVFRCDCRPDVRAAQMWRLLALPAHRAVPLLYARMVSLHTLLERPANAMPLPDKLWLSAEKLEPDGVFLLENGYEAFIWVGKAVPPATATALFGVPSLDAWDPQQPLMLPTLNTPLNSKVRDLLDEVRRQRTAFLRLRVVRRGDTMEQTFYSALVEDRSPQSGMSYVEFLCFLHRQIQNKLA
ncbi:transport Sec24-like protein [Micractinium conductrix]|uniref:Transport Sec24-like protein n=1 Tax=Micractinium conductrix TaxID=554055 RepID=A0A2P6V2J6_9CHLO|nr:transport Sec24-like protein [Micractinium conductrix]|eukprot:PSC68317.1 transport Sec24-like protein [Micractinium conductrix]